MEEIVVNAHAFGMQHLRPDLSNQLLGRRSRSHVGLVPHRPAAVRVRQGPRVKLAVGRQRQFAQRHEHRWNHRFVQPRAEECSQTLDLRLVVPRRHHVGHQPLLARSIFARHHRRLGDLWMARQEGRHLLRFDAKTANLHLVVDTPQNLHVAVGQIATEVARPVDSIFLATGEGIGKEPFVRQGCIAQVPPGQVGRTDMDLPDFANAAKCPGRIDQQELHVVDAPADRDAGRAACRMLPPHLITADRLGGLRRTVEVHHRGRRRYAAETRYGVIPQDIAAEKHVTERFDAR